MKLTGENRSTWGKTCPSVTLSTTNPTWTDPGSNPRLRGGRPATNRLSQLHGLSYVYSVYCGIGSLFYPTTIDCHLLSVRVLKTLEYPCKHNRESARSTDCYRVLACSS
jgi:hypothetical protein